MNDPPNVNSARYLYFSKKKKRCFQMNKYLDQITVIRSVNGISNNNEIIIIIRIKYEIRNYNFHQPK